ncbi:hypothetical protein BDV25DRAFT_168005 [Aspergillus avenaceus]|uniref:Rhodopsin domain-containing protein n=1 Tax=Aspergillus avenaceus TaxID=36643 RepID=A0A5N6U606_ASPAV|nr:hypothetical protein BDV25DRAFT_168005 [Aspergillus avenaceus]
MYVVPVASTLLALSIVIVAVRLYARLYFIRTPGWDDLVIVVALLSAIACFAFIVIEVRYGLGNSIQTISPKDLRAQMKALWVSIPFYNLSLTLTKASMVLLYLRLFPLRNYQIVLYLILTFVILSGLWMVFGSIFECIPVQGFWDPSIPHRCIPRTAMWSLNAALQISTDLTIVIVPMPLLTQLQLPRRQKMALILVFALGLFVCAVSAVRLAAVVKMIQSPDKTKWNESAALWSIVEANVAIICACLPPLRPLIVHIFPRLFASQVRSQPEKPPLNLFDTANPFNFQNTSYAASVTGNCSTNNNGRDPHPDTEGIQVVSEVHWDSGSVDGIEDDHSQKGLEPSGRGTVPGRERMASVV